MDEPESREPGLRLPKKRGRKPDEPYLLAQRNQKALAKLFYRRPELLELGGVGAWMVRSMMEEA